MISSEHTQDNLWKKEASLHSETRKMLTRKTRMLTIKQNNKLITLTSTIILAHPRQENIIRPPVLCDLTKPHVIISGACHIVQSFGRSSSSQREYNISIQLRYMETK